ncbi:MAG: MFS transporter, partial [Alphaproteobacteria bacterium]|nr:MFS transporter [Alphaproteobacteria bacterium]
YLNWRFVFWIALPLGVLALFCAATLLNKLPRHERPRKLDILGACLIVAASSIFMFVMNAGGKTWPWASVQIVGILFLSACFWALFVWRLLSAPEPLIPLGMLRNQIVRTSTFANASGWAAVIGLNVYLPLYLQAIHGMSPAQAGLYLMVVMVTVNSSALVGAQVAARVVHYKRFPMATLAVSIAAILYMAWRVDTMTPLEFEIVLAIMGVGFGPVAPVTTVATQNAVKLNELGTATAVMSFTRSLFAAILVTGLGAIVLHTVSGAGASGVSGAEREAAVHAFRMLFLVTAGAFAVTFVSFWMMEEKPLLNSNEGRMG